MSIQRNLLALAVFGASSLGALAQTTHMAQGTLRGEIKTAANASHGVSASREQVRADAAAALAADQITRGDAVAKLPVVESMKTRAEVGAEARRAPGPVRRGDA